MVRAIPEILPRQSLSNFLVHCQTQGVRSIDLLLQPGSPSDAILPEREDLIVVPYFLNCRGLNEDQALITVMRGDYFTNVPYARSDTHLREPLVDGIVCLGKPQERIRLYGQECADFCAQYHFDARVFMYSPLSGTVRKCVYKVKSGQGKHVETVRAFMVL